MIFECLACKRLYNYNISQIFLHNPPRNIYTIKPPCYASKNAVSLRRFSTNYGNNNNENKWRNNVIGRQPLQNLKVGPYKRGKWFVGYKDDPGGFITNLLIIIVTVYSIFTLTPGESMKTRRQRKLRQLLLDKANLTEAELDYIENYKLSTHKDEK